MPQGQNDDHAPEMQSSPTEIKDAPAPFDDRDADVILRSCDLVDFRVFKVVLSFASPVFKSMFTLPQSPSSARTIVADDDDHRDGIPVVRLSEDATTLESVLRACYPGTSPHIDCLEDIVRVLTVAEKYEMEVFRVTAREMLLNGLESRPFLRYAIARRFKFKDVCTRAAVASLVLSHKAILQYPSETVTSPLLSLITADQFRHLLLYHYRCGEVASGVPLSRHWLSTLPPLIMSRALQCSRCQEKRTPVDTDGQAQPPPFYAPTLLWNTLDRVARALRETPDAKGATNVFQSAGDVGSCGLCLINRSGLIVLVRQSLMDAINVAVAEVKPSDFGIES
ncbi:uncharacterized protein STEHIDRAFT_159480 [Stereum hirsutum FP-91666 SS1]|uniref:uncharacterized protein n=1 Tax=Stereum hirsutum (strain FP-91666) TaxID=721885 RepID=UPI0004449CDF|nr:uncharacterized protein STEHIDRAFT_159480 [Stereum hirsutum FP-91666 SS1]EIM83865.1 hypothetical protein STEHIDRAFT_159480 [Stereum hirsutum FP-91666 SS1]